jgi:hypothetical protein
MNGRFALSVAASGTFGVALVALGWHLSAPGHDRAVTYLVGVIGMVVGWPVGILVSPHDSKEEETFSGAAKVV